MPYSPDTPTFPEQYERIQGKTLEGADLEAYLAINAIWNQASKALFLPTDTPEDIVVAWRLAFEKIAADPEFIAAAAETLGPAELIIGEAAGPIIKSAATLSNATVEQLNAALKANKLTFRIK